MSDVTRPPGDDTAAAPDARGESALGTGHGTTPRTDRTDKRRTEADRGDAYGTGAERTTDTSTTPMSTKGIDTKGTSTTGTSITGTSAKGTSATGAATLGAHGGDTLGTSKGTPSDARAHLFPHDESDKLGSQLQHAVAGFVDGPRASVEEADHVLEEIAARFTEAVTQRRRTLRHSWQSVESGEGKPVSSADTEQLRLALKDYRELAERLLHV
jgi:hypothetical protein